MNRKQFEELRLFLEKYSGKLHGAIHFHPSENKLELRLMYYGDFVNGKFTEENPQYFLIPIEETP